MPKTQQDFLEEARREIPEVSVEEVEARRKRGDDFILLDVREKDEVRSGYIEGAMTIPRGFLEFQAAGHGFFGRGGRFGVGGVHGRLKLIVIRFHRG